MAAVKYLLVRQGEKLGIEVYPSFHRTGNVAAMKRRFYGKGALLVRCGSWIYHVSNAPEIYHRAK